MNMTNKLILPVESRMQGDLHVRFGGRLWETYHRKVARRPSPSLHVKYADEPLLLNVEMCDFIHDGESVNRPNNAMESVSVSSICSKGCTPIMTCFISIPR